MLKLEQVKRRPEESEDCLREKAASLLRIPPEEILSLTVLRRAVDARSPRLVENMGLPQSPHCKKPE